MNNEKRIKRSVYLFPNYFKKIGVVLLVFAIGLFIVQTQTNFLAFDKDYQIVTTTILAALGLINFAKEKFEDERIRKIRYVTWSYSFYGIITTVLLGRIFYIFFNSAIEYYNSSVAVLITYLLLNIAFFEANKQMDVDEE